MKPNACNIAIRPNTTPVAPLAEVPSVPTKYVSAMLYILVTSMEMIVGMPREMISFATGVSVILIYCSSLIWLMLLSPVLEYHSKDGSKFLYGQEAVRDFLLLQYHSYQEQ